MIKEGTYSVEFFEQEVPGKALNPATVEEEGNVVDPLIAVEAIQKVGDIDASVITYSVKRDDTVLFDGRSIDYAAPQRDNVMVLDGLLFTIRGPSPGFKDFQITANAGGPVDPPAFVPQSRGITTASPMLKA